MCDAKKETFLGTQKNNDDDDEAFFVSFREKRQLNFLSANAFQTFWEKWNFLSLVFFKAYPFASNYLDTVTFGRRNFISKKYCLLNIFGSLGYVPRM
jgi:hypothetical protein